MAKDIKETISLIPEPKELFEERMRKMYKLNDEIKEAILNLK